MSDPVVAFFHPRQLAFRPRYEWALGTRLAHPERTERADRILAALSADARSFTVQTPVMPPVTTILEQHAADLLSLYVAATELERELYPTVFLRPRDFAPDPGNLCHAGYFCFDSGTPLTAEAYDAALWSAACAESAARAVRDGARLAYALSRPPGHHASHDRFGGYCYLNNAAWAARTLGGRVCILDIDAHHGDGVQALFWRDPNGDGLGHGYNLNIALVPGTDGTGYLARLEAEALPAIETFAPDAIVLAAGVDGYVDDPIGNLALTTADFHRIGERIGALGLPTCAVQEGGYYTPAIGDNVTALLAGLREGQASALDFSLASHTHSQESHDSIDPS